MPESKERPSKKPHHKKRIMIVRSTWNVSGGRSTTSRWRFIGGLLLLERLKDDGNQRGG
jgi:hypothetical protein